MWCFEIELAMLKRFCPYAEVLIELTYRRNAFRYNPVTRYQQSDDVVILWAGPIAVPAETESDHAETV